MTRLPRCQINAIVKENIPLCREHFRLTLSLPTFPATEPGQFLQLLCRSVCDDDQQQDLEWEPGQPLDPSDPDLLERAAMLRRPFSLAGRRDGIAGVELDIIHRVVGVGTSWLSNLKLGDSVGVLGPLGNSFELPPPGTTALLVAGGVGIPPMLYLAEKLKGRAVAFCGATIGDLLPLSITQDAEQDPSIPAHRIAEFSRYNIPSVITTDDGSIGVGGFVTHALKEFLKRSAVDCSAFTIYTCGPELMMRRVADIAIERGIPCQVAVERAMACGMGTCQSCCIKVRVGQDWRYKLACTDGPIFAAVDLLW